MIDDDHIDLSSLHAWTRHAYETSYNYSMNPLFSLLLFLYWKLNSNEWTYRDDQTVGRGNHLLGSTGQIRCASAVLSLTFDMPGCFTCVCVCVWSAIDLLFLCCVDQVRSLCKQALNFLLIRMVLGDKRRYTPRSIERSNDEYISSVIVWWCNFSSNS